MGFDLPGRGNRVRPSMNVTPLVDIVLVLLIIFMVITPMLMKQFWLHLPKREETKTEAAGPAEAQAPVVLTLRGDGTVWINKDQVALPELPGRLERIFAARRDHLVFFDVNDAVPYAQAMEVMDAARGGGAVHIAVLTEALP
jgi:biopolymer transport protein ExbD/biopolymer transport protein TolR